MAEAFSALLKLLWGNAASVVSPRKFKFVTGPALTPTPTPTPTLTLTQTPTLTPTLTRFVMGQHAPQFVGYAQHDSQALLHPNPSPDPSP